MKSFFAHTILLSAFAITALTWSPIEASAANDMFKPSSVLFDSALPNLFLDSQSWMNNELQTISPQAGNLDPTVLKLALTAYKKAKALGIKSKDILTIIDYSKPSTEKRLWVVDVNNERVLFHTYVAHGKNSGTLVPTSFSNKVNSKKSSFGVFITDDTYQGHNGESLRIKGLESGVNDNVYKRHVVFHGSNYVSETVAKKRGMIGRSQGCMAVSRDMIKPIIHTIKDQSLVFAYYPDQKWLSTSTFLKADAMSNQEPRSDVNSVRANPRINSRQM